MGKLKPETRKRQTQKLLLSVESRVPKCATHLFQDLKYKINALHTKFILKVSTIEIRQVQNRVLVLKIFGFVDNIHNLIEMSSTLASIKPARFKG